jgi:hypothetical protein
MRLSEEKAWAWLTDRLESVVIKTHNRSESEQLADILDIFCDNPEWIRSYVRKRNITRIGPIRLDKADKMLVLKHYSSDDNAEYDGCKIVDFSSFLNEISENSVSLFKYIGGGE